MIRPRIQLPFVASPSMATQPVATSSPATTPGPQGDGREAFTVRMQPDLGVVTPERSVYSTRKRWRAVDVYCVPPTMPAGTFLRFRVYAIADGVGRVLVASGFLSSTPANVSTVRLRRWVCAARAICDRFEITVQSIGFLSIAGEEMQVSCVASDEATEVPLYVGAADLFDPANASIATTRILPSAGAASDPSYDTEIVGIFGANDTGAPAFIQIHDDVTTVPTAAPVIVVAVPDGGSVAVGPDVLAAYGYRFGERGCMAAWSTTPKVYTGIAPTASLWWRIIGR
jgi:hypothetical protein